MSADDEAEREQRRRQAEVDRLVAAGIGAVSELQPLLDTLDGMVAAIESRGFTVEQARAIVAGVLGNPGRPS